ncbi:MAG: alpha-isopropylmalate synthase regulatory domain-containing protein [Methanomicrobiales archaeon]
MIPTASVRRVVNGVEMTGAAPGDAPVDAAMSVLLKSVAELADIRLEECYVDAISGGTDALVEVTVRLSKDGKIIT